MCFATHELILLDVCLQTLSGSFLADLGEPELAKTLFWYSMGYENLLFQIDDIMTTDSSIFNVVSELSFAKTQNNHLQERPRGDQVDVGNRVGLRVAGTLGICCTMPLVLAWALEINLSRPLGLIGALELAVRARFGSE